MLKKAGRFKKNKNFFQYKFSIYLILIMLFLLNINLIINVKSASFIPASPTGNISTEINVDNEYKIVTSEVGSTWKFDWGDGNYSNWLTVEESDSYVSEKHSWVEYGTYEVRVKHRSIYLVESSWSLPLIVNVETSSDIDNDGWSNLIEQGYGTDLVNPNDHPIDTDDDGTADDNSPNDEFIGDTDDDNDGVNDELEENIGSNTKDPNDITIIVIDSSIFYIVDANTDGTNDFLYNTNNDIKTDLLNKDGLIYLDTNADGKKDYIYNNGVLTIYEEDNEIPWLYIIIGIIIAVICIILILFLTGRLYFYEEEYISEE